MASSIPPWSHLPRELLGLVIDRLDSPLPDSESCRLAALWSKALQLLPFHDATARFRLAADRARFRAVCRSWCLAMREHATPGQLPWIVMSDGSFMAPSVRPAATLRGSSCRRLPSVPKNATCIGSTDSWLVLDCIDDNRGHSYLLHNLFSNTSVPLPELDDVIGDVSELFEVRKVLMRSTIDDIVAVMTNNWNHPIILVRPGKGVWLPKPQAAPFIYIIDIAFLGDKLYGITQAEDLVSLDITFDDNNGRPNVTNFERLITHPPVDYNIPVWSDDDEDGDNNEIDDDDVNKDHPYHEIKTEGDDDYMNAIWEIRGKTGDDMMYQGITYWEEGDDLVGIVWYLLKSCGKLFVVKRQLVWPSPVDSFTRKVEVYELNLRTCAPVPVIGGLDGHAFFISKRFCKSIAAHGDIDKDTIYFADTDEAFNVISQTLSPPQRKINHLEVMWNFSPALVV